MVLLWSLRVLFLLLLFMLFLLLLLLLVLLLLWLLKLQFLLMLLMLFLLLLCFFVYFQLCTQRPIEEKASLNAGCCGLCFLVAGLRATSLSDVDATNRPWLCACARIFLETSRGRSVRVRATRMLKNNRPPIEASLSRDYSLHTDRHVHSREIHRGLKHLVQPKANNAGVLRFWLRTLPWMSAFSSMSRLRSFSQWR